MGCSRTIQVDVQIVAATNRDLNAMVAENRFRADLYYLLAVFRVTVPPLRERREDIPLLACYFVQKHAACMDRKIQSIPTYALGALTNYDWPAIFASFKMSSSGRWSRAKGLNLTSCWRSLDGRAALLRFTSALRM